jgi:hypothetical protein
MVTDESIEEISGSRNNSCKYSQFASVNIWLQKCQTPVKNYLAKHNVMDLEHLPYSLDFPTPEFSYFCD